MWALLLAMTTVAAVVVPGSTYGLNATALVDWEAHTPVPPSLVCVCAFVGCVFAHVEFVGLKKDLVLVISCFYSMNYM